MNKIKKQLVEDDLKSMARVSALKLLYSIIDNVALDNFDDKVYTTWAALEGPIKGTSFCGLFLTSRLN